MSIQGKKSIFYIKHLGVFYPISCEINSNISETTEMLETTTRDNTGGWKTSTPTKQSYTISFSGLAVKEFDSSTFSYWELVKKKRNRELIEWKQKTLNGYYVVSGKAYISSIDMTNNVDEFIMFNITFEGYGELEVSSEAVGVLATTEDEGLLFDNDDTLIYTEI